MREKSCLYSLKNVGNCSNGGIKYKLSALLYISYLEKIKYESMLKPLIVTFQDVGIFFKKGFSIFFLYILFFQIDGSHFVFLSFFI